MLPAIRSRIPRDDFEAAARRQHHGLSPPGARSTIKTAASAPRHFHFKRLRQTAEQLTDLDRWYRILSFALVKYLKGRQLDPPRRLQHA
jgi:hypothetical protein